MGDAKKSRCCLLPGTTYYQVLYTKSSCGKRHKHYILRMAVTETACSKTDQIITLPRPSYYRTVYHVAGMNINIHTIISMYFTFTVHCLHFVSASSHPRGSCGINTRGKVFYWLYYSTIPQTTDHIVAVTQHPRIPSEPNNMIIMSSCDS